MKKEIRLEQLIGKQVLDRNGKFVGRISEIEAEWQGHRCVVTELCLGDDVRVPARAIDLSDPSRPTLI